MARFIASDYFFLRKICCSPFIQLPLNGFHCNVLPVISDNVILRPFTRDPSSSRNKPFENTIYKYSPHLSDAIAI